MNTHVEPPQIGDNRPPDAIDFAREAYKALSEFMKDTPVIETYETASAAKLHLDRAKATAKDLEAAKDAEAGPRYQAWQEALAKFKPAATALDKITKELSLRIQQFLDAEKAKRQAEADRIYREAKEAARIAEEAAIAEAEARDNASQGEIGVDVGAAIDTLAHAAIEAERLSRQSAVADRDANNVRLAGGFGRSISVRSHMVPIVEDYKAAIKALGLTDDIRAAILKGARAYKKLNGAYPKGIGEVEERTL